MQTSKKQHDDRIKMFMSLANHVYKMFNVIERNDIIRIYGYKYKFRVIDLYDTGEADVIPLDVRDPNFLECRQRTSLKYAKLYIKFFKTNQDMYRSAKFDNGWRLIGDAMVNINGPSINRRDSGQGIRLPEIGPKIRRRIKKPKILTLTQMR